MPPFHAYSFIPSITWPPRLPLAHRLANLLLSDRVQEISFTFGSVVTLPEDFRFVAAALVQGDIRVSTDANLVPAGDRALYDKSENIIRFCQDNILDFPEGRSVAVHESVHAAHDIKRRNTSVRSEESAARIAAAWYLCTKYDPRPAATPVAIWDVAVQIRDRAFWESKPAHATGSEIKICRSAIAHKYVNGHYMNNGV